MKKPTLLYLSRADVEACQLSTVEVIELVGAALAAKGKSQAAMPPKPGIRPLPDAFLHALPCYLPRMEVAGIKWVGGFPANTEKGLPYLSGVIVLNDVETGMPFTIMDCTWITTERNGASAAVAAQYLANPDSRTVGLLGCTPQARVCIAGLGAIFTGLNALRLYDPVPERQKAFAAEMESIPQLEVVDAGSPQGVFQGADIVLTAASIFGHPGPAIEPGWQEKGSFALALGLDSSWGPDALRAADKLCTDDTPQLAYYASEGYFRDVPPVYADLGEIIAGRKPGREHRDETIISLNLGVAVTDIAVAARIYQIALQKGLGRELPL